MTTLEKITNTNNTIIQIKLESILATFDEEQKEKYKSHLTSLTQDFLNRLEETLSAEQIQEVKKVLGL
ncbi:hypothetical protein [Flavobacterium psychrophilum]|uniref:hypothetical protein n=1 Tax=Flavobacterium psychrophilum TaxID=96345 RepID=UPI000B8ED16D|nr:hypothetical protein [Flavobacterium psychrophilum]